MNKIKIHLAFILLFFGNQSNAFSSQDTTQNTKHHLVQPAFDFDQRFSFINKKSVNIWGYRVGLMVKEKYKIGIGGYYLNDQVNSRKTDSAGNPAFTYNRKMYFGTVYFEPFLIRKKYWETSIVSELGFGKNEENAISASSQSINKYFIPAGLGLSLNLKCPEIHHYFAPTWFGLNFMLGYRKTLFEKELKSHYDGVYWSIGTAIFVDKAVVDIKHWIKKKRA